MDDLTNDRRFFPQISLPVPNDGDHEISGESIFKEETEQQIISAAILDSSLSGSSVYNILTQLLPVLCPQSAFFWDKLCRPFSHARARGALARHAMHVPSFIYARVLGLMGPCEGAGTGEKSVMTIDGSPVELSWVIAPGPECPSGGYGPAGSSGSRLSPLPPPHLDPRMASSFQLIMEYFASLRDERKPRFQLLSSDCCLAKNRLKVRDRGPPASRGAMELPLSHFLVADGPRSRCALRRRRAAQPAEENDPARPHAQHPVGGLLYYYELIPGTSGVFPKIYLPVRCVSTLALLLLLLELQV
ncbi:hypothetical protein BD779DRAFT_1682885 [Infundibulicybe gibba]|nr:hypothetical protein BD779DRAFT_1682885 [Infundibulicybe gibba]